MFHLWKTAQLLQLKTMERVKNAAATGMTNSGATTRISTTATPWAVTLLPGLDSMLFKLSLRIPKENQIGKLLLLPYL